jgi:hypothetical protein
VGPWALILRKISDVESPFSRAHFDDSRAQGMLARLISHSREMLYRVDGDLGHFSEAEISNFFVAFQDLVDLWPYALLRVQPPYGYHTQNLREDLNDIQRLPDTRAEGSLAEDRDREWSD